MQTKTLDKLYLEWSQFTDARTSREINMKRVLTNLASAVHAYYIDGKIENRIDMHVALNEAKYLLMSNKHCT